MSGISRAFSANDGSRALVVYLMGGDPDIDASYKLAGAAVAGGADLIELGVPFSDPIADGKSIQAAGVRALKSSIKPSDIIRLAYEVKRDYHVPIALMTYYNIIYSKGIQNMLDAMKKADVDGVIVPDLPLEESTELRIQAEKKGIDTILMAAPTTKPDRLVKIANATKGFLYLVSVTGITGARSEILKSSLQLVSEAKKLVKGCVPVAVGFGISRPSHVSSFIKAGADGVVVGSAIIDIASSSGDSQKMLSEVEAFVASLKKETKVS